MRRMKWILAVLLAVMTLIYLGNGLAERMSGRDAAPRITCGEEILEVSIHADDAALLAGVTAEDDQDGDLTDRIIVGGVSKLIGGNTAKVTCMVFDSDDNMASVVRTVRYTDYRRPVISLKEPMICRSTDDAKLLKVVEVTDALDGDLSHKARVSTLWSTEDERVYSATILVTNSMGDTATVEVPVIIGQGLGGIRLKEQILYLSRGSSFDPMTQVTSGRTGLTVDNQVNVEEPGCYWVWYHGADGDLAILTVVVE